jgi:hypothetical protein
LNFEGMAASAILSIRQNQKGMAGTTGLEPAASAVTGQRSNQLNYVPTRQLNEMRIMRLYTDCTPWIDRAGLPSRDPGCHHSGPNRNKCEQACTTEIS